MQKRTLKEISATNKAQAEKLQELTREIERNKATIHNSEGLEPTNFLTYEAYTTNQAQLKEAKEALKFNMALLEKMKTADAQTLQELFYSLEGERDKVINKYLPKIIEKANELTELINAAETEDAKIKNIYEEYKAIHVGQFPAFMPLNHKNKRYQKALNFTQSFYFDATTGEKIKR